MGGTAGDEAGGATGTDDILICCGDSGVEGGDVSGNGDGGESGNGDGGGSGDGDGGGSGDGDGGGSGDGGGGPAGGAVTPSSVIVLPMKKSTWGWLGAGAVVPAGPATAAALMLDTRVNTEFGLGPP